MNDAQLVRREQHGAVSIVIIDNPPVNAIAVGVPKGIVEAITDAQADPSVTALIVTGGGRGTIAGADIRMFGKPWPKTEPRLWDVIDSIEASPKPVVAALPDLCLGGGLELAMACHYRVIAAKGMVGQPEVKLGMPPGAGGTQRLPRLAGVAKALDMILTGEPIAAQEALQYGVVDAVLEGDFLSEACGFAERKVSTCDTHPLVRDKTLQNPDPDIFDKTRAKIAKRARGQLAPFACIDCVEAATTMSFDQGIRFERETAEACKGSIEGAALRHVFFAERAARKIPGVTRDTPIDSIERGGVIGAGTMGGGIAMCFANAGMPVILIEREQDALDRGLSRIRSNYEASAKRGRLSRQDIEQRMALIAPRLDFGALKDADIVIEAVFEEMDVKKKVFRELDKVCKGNAILATNTSYLDVDQIASVASERKPNIVGTHFFSPANVMRLLEVVRASAVSPRTLASVTQLGRRLGKIPIVAGVCHGFIGNRMLEGYFREAHFLLEEGAMPEQVDQVLTEFGMAMGPFAVADLAGLDISWANRKANAHKRDPSKRYSVVADRLCERGWFGQKIGRGFYRYEQDGRRPISDPEVQELIIEVSKALGIERRAIDSEEILLRCLAPLVNEGARILQEGIALRASDIDLVWINGYGFPSWRGGPMFWAERRGLTEMLEAIRRFNTQHDFWEPAPLLEQLVSDGKGFAETDRAGQ